MKSFEAIAHSAYEAFGTSLKHLDPFQLPTWQQLPETTRQAWIAAARKVAEEIQQVH